MGQTDICKYSENQVTFEETQQLLELSEEMKMSCFSFEKKIRIKLICSTSTSHFNRECISIEIHLLNNFTGSSWHTAVFEHTTGCKFTLSSCCDPAQQDYRYFAKHTCSAFSPIEHKASPILFIFNPNPCDLHKHKSSHETKSERIRTARKDFKWPLQRPQCSLRWRSIVYIHKTWSAGFTDWTLHLLRQHPSCL